MLDSSYRKIKSSKEATPNLYPLKLEYRLLLLGGLSNLRGPARGWEALVMELSGGYYLGGSIL